MWANETKDYWILQNHDGKNWVTDDDRKMREKHLIKTFKLPRWEAESQAKWEYAAYKASVGQTVKAQTQPLRSELESERWKTPLDKLVVDYSTMYWAEAWRREAFLRPAYNATDGKNGHGFHHEPLFEKERAKIHKGHMNWHVGMTAIRLHNRYWVTDITERLQAEYLSQTDMKLLLNQIYYVHNNRHKLSNQELNKIKLKNVLSPHAKEFTLRLCEIVIKQQITDWLFTKWNDQKLNKFLASSNVASLSYILIYADLNDILPNEALLRLWTNAQQHLSYQDVYNTNARPKKALRGSQHKKVDHPWVEVRIKWLDY